jgi:hypothetical protein
MNANRRVKLVTSFFTHVTIFPERLWSEVGFIWRGLNLEIQVKIRSSIGRCDFTEG